MRDANHLIILAPCFDVLFLLPALLAPLATGLNFRGHGSLLFEQQVLVYLLW